jgi:hypothetical protein
MAIKFAVDVGVPLGVTVVDLLSESAAPASNEPIAYLAAGLGYIGAGMGFGGDAVKNMGIASFDWAGKHLYNRVKSMAGTKRMGAVARVGTYPQNPVGYDKVPLV